MIANPPYGKDWKRDQVAVRDEHDRGAAGRFAPGLPRISDGQLLFLLHMLAHAKEPDEEGSRIAIIMNGSPLFTGDAGSGESEIRRWILENDLLEALIALPEQLFYNTGIATYVWILTNRKRPERRGKVQLIDATSFWVLLRRSLGAKRREIPFEKKQDILGLLANFTDGETRKVVEDGEERDVIVSRIYPTEHFGFRKITVERPLRLDFQASPKLIARLENERAFANLPVSRKRGDAKAKDEAEGRKQQAAIRALVRSLPDRLFLDRAKIRRRIVPSHRSGGRQADRTPTKGDSLSPFPNATQRPRSVGIGTGSPSPILNSAAVRTSRSSRTSTRSSSARSSLMSPTPGSTPHAATSTTEKSE